MSTLDHVFSLIRFSHFTQHLSSCIYVIRSTQCRVQTMYVVCYFFPFFCVSIYFYSLFIFKACSSHSCVCIVWASFACLKSVLTAFLCRFKAPCLLRGLLLHALVQTPHRVGVSSGMFLSVLEASSIGNGVVCF